MVSSMSVFKTLLGINWAIFLWDLYLDYRQYQVHLKNEKRPKKVEDMITDEEYMKAREYKLDKARFGFINDIFEQFFTTYVLVSGWMPCLWDLCESLPLQAVMFVTANTLIHSLIELPWDMYDTFVIEQKHGFNKQTISFYLCDTLKKQAVSLALTAPVVLIVEWIITNGGPYFFVYAWMFVSVVIFILLTIYPAFIAPLFDKYIPLPDGELKTAIEKLAASVSFPLTKLYVVHGSKRSAHSNAYMYGFWKNKRIVLYDTLLSGEEKEKVMKECAEDEKEEEEELNERDKARGMSNAEVVAVLGHELGHWALSHTLVNLVIAELNLFFMFAVFGYFYKWKAMYEAFGFTSTPVVVGLLLVFQYVMAMYNHVTGILLSMHSRKCEFQADEYAAKLGYAPQLRTALTKLSKDNLAMPIDDPLYSMCNHSHPPVVERIAALEGRKKDE